MQISSDACCNATDGPPLLRHSLYQAFMISHIASSRMAVKAPHEHRSCQAPILHYTTCCALGAAPTFTPVRHGLSILSADVGQLAVNSGAEPPTSKVAEPQQANPHEGIVAEKVIHKVATVPLSVPGHRYALIGRFVYIPM